MTHIIEAEKIAKAYKELKGSLTLREKDIITRYYGIEPHVRHTLAEIGAIYKVTRERIRQIKVEALVKLNILNPVVKVGKHTKGLRGSKISKK